MASQYMIPGFGVVHDVADGKQIMLPGGGVLHSNAGISAMQTAHRTSITADHAVQFSVNVGITAGDAIPIHTGAELVDHVLYVWDFGDANDFVDGNNLRIGFGANVSHVYKTAGSYTATLYAIEDGVTSTFQQTITVSAYGGVHRYIDAETGSDSNDGTQATVGGAGVGPWATATRAHNDFFALAAGTARRYNFAAVTTGGASQTYSHSIGGSGNIGTRTALAEFIAYDPGSTGIKPVIQTSNANGWMHMASDTDDVLVKGIHFQNLVASGSNIAVRPGKNTCLLNCIFDAYDSSISTSASHGNKEYFVMQQCRHINTRRYGAFFNFGRYNAAIANVVDGVSTTSGEHLLRLYWDKSYVAYNELIGGSANNKNQIKWVGFAPVGSASRPSQVPSDIAASTYCTVWRNKGHSPTAGMDWLFAFSPIDNTNDELSTQLMVWENRVVMGGDARVCYYINCAANSYCNNVADLSGSTNTTRMGFQVVRRGVEVVPDDNHLYHNTVYCNGGSGTIRPFSVDVGASTTPDGNDLRNNLTNIISGSGTVSGTDGIVDGGTNTTKTPNLLTTSATALTAPGGVDGDYRPTDGGAAVDLVTRLADCYLPTGWDLTMTPRPATASASDYGAYEFVSVVFAPPEPEPLVPSTGVNLDKCKWDGTAYIFKDRMKQSGVENGTYAAYGWQTINSGTLADTADTVTNYIGADGWPDVTLPASSVTIETYMMSPVSGSHTVYFDGAGTLIFRTVSGGTFATISSSGSTITVTAADTEFRMRVSSTDVGNPIRNIRVVPAAYTGDYTTDPFYPPLLTRLQDFATAGTRVVLRAMELTRTNGDKPVTGWANRSLTTWNSQATGFGMAWETVFDLANAVGADLWINCPHQADATYMSSLATLALSDLDTNLRLFVEFSNEVWNDSFDQGVYADDQGNTAGFTGTADEKGYKWYAKQSAALFDAFKTAWGASSFRLIKVLGTQASSTTVTNTILDYFEETAIDSIAVNANGTKVNCVAMAPYFGRHNDDGSPDAGDYFGEDAFDNNWHTTMPVATAISTIRSTYMPLAVSFMQSQKDAVATLAAVASKPYTGAQLICYEGGSSITSDVAGDQSDATLTAWLKAIQNDSRFYDLCLEYLAEWENIGGTLFVWFHFCDAWTGPDMFGAMESLSQDIDLAPKYRAIRDFADGIRPAPGGGGNPGGAVEERPPWRQFRWPRAFRAYDGRTVRPTS